MFIGRNDAKAETPVLWPPHERVDSLEKTLLLGGIGGRRRRGRWQTAFFWAPKSLQMVTAAMKLKDTYSLEGKL